MGNHDVGRAMAGAAEAFFIGNDEALVSKERAMAVLDAAAKNFHGADAEFDDEFHGETPLSRLVAIAFDASPEEIASRDDPDEDDGGEKWYAGPYTRFKNRYRFC